MRFVSCRGLRLARCIATGLTAAALPAAVLRVVLLGDSLIAGYGLAPDDAHPSLLQRDLTAQFPNVSVVDVQEILAAVIKVLGTVTLAVTVVGSLVLVSGILILIGSISMTRFQRTYEAAILKTLGATTRRIAAMLAVEYGLLGFLAGVIGSAGALVLSWAVSAFVLDVPWQPTPGPVVAGVLASSALVTLVGILASLDVLRRKPLATLRAE
jgi:putative ABC transport system permease protein